MQNNIGQRLKTARNSIGFTQKEMADACSIPYRTYQGYELNKSKPSFDVIEFLFINYNIEINWLLYDIGAMLRIQDNEENVDRALLIKIMELIESELERTKTTIPFKKKIKYYFQLHDEIREENFTFEDKEHEILEMFQSLTRLHRK